MDWPALRPRDKDPGCIALCLYECDGARWWGTDVYWPEGMRWCNESESMGHRCIGWVPLPPTDLKPARADL